MIASKTYNWANTNKLQEPCSSISRVNQDLAATLHFVVAVGNTTNQWYHVFRIL